MAMGAYEVKESTIQARDESRNSHGAWQARRGYGHRNLEKHSEAGGSETMKKYLIIVEKTETGYSAFSPDVPGCGSTGKTKDEVERNIQEAIEFHLEGLRLEGYEVPEPTTYSSYIDIAA